MSLPSWRRDNIEQLRSCIDYGEEFVEPKAHPNVFPVVRVMLRDELAPMFSDDFSTAVYTSPQIRRHRDAHP